MCNLSLNQILLKIYNEFESDEIKIEFERIYQRNGKTRIEIKVIDDEGNILHDGAIVVD